MRTLLTALILFVGILAPPAPAARPVSPGELPTAPHGFSWVDFKEGKTSFLKPIGWYEKREIRDNVAALFITKENIETNGKFETGLTLNYFEHAHRSVNAVPSEFAQKFVALMAAKHTLSASFKSAIGPDITGFGFRFRDDIAPPKIVHYFIVADDPADTIRIIFFEAPASEWDSAWVVGKQMLNARMWR
jgi:hypothetical protein